MTQPFPQAITAKMPSDDELVIGKVASGNPLTITRGGVPVTGVGRLRGSSLNVGDNVALIRQDSTWLALDAIIPVTSSGYGIASIQQAAANAILPLTAVQQDVPGTTLNFSTTAPAATLVAIWFADYEVTAAATAVGTTMIRIDGVTLTSPAAIWQDVATGNRGTVGQAVVTTVAPGDHSAILRANRVGGADGQLRLNNAHTTLLLAVLQ